MASTQSKNTFRLPTHLLANKLSNEPLDRLGQLIIIKHRSSLFAVESERHLATVEEEFLHRHQPLDEKDIGEETQRRPIECRDLEQKVHVNLLGHHHDESVGSVVLHKAILATNFCLVCA